ncbi:Protein of unknown function [Gryllus bimaculatus]|nr:Protein of unknown function [Gryllus bimaculatus]
MSWEAIPYATDAVRFVQPACRPGPRAAAPLHSSPASAPKGWGAGVGAATTPTVTASGPAAPAPQPSGSVI